MKVEEILKTINDLIKIAPDKGSYAMSYKMWKQLLDYITNLQEENEKLKQKLSEKPKILTYDYTSDVYEELEDYKSRCEKLELENKVLKEQMVAMVQPNYVYGIELKGVDSYEN